MRTFFKKLADTLRKTALGVAIGGSALSSAVAQNIAPSGTYSVSTVTLPYSTLAPGAAGSGGTSTNLGLGWSTILTNVTTSTTWNSSSNAFISVTNTIYTTNTTYADMQIQQQKNLMVSVGFNGSGPTNRTLTFARFLDNGTVDNINTTNVTILALAGATNTIANINFSADWLAGAGGVRIVNDLWTGTNATLTMTNNFIKYGVKKYAF